MSFSAKTVRSVLSIVLIISLFMLVSCTQDKGPITANKEKLPEYQSEFDSTKFYSIIHKSEKYTLDSRSNLASGTYYIDSRAPKENADAQQYQIAAIADNEYQIISKLFGKAAKYSSSMQTEKLVLDNNRQTVTQKWQITKAEGDYYKIKNMSTDKYIAIVNGKLAQLAADNEDQDALLWKIQEAFVPKFTAEPEWAEDFNSSQLNTEVWTFNAATKRTAKEVEDDRGPDKDKPNLVERSSNVEENLSMKQKTAVLTLNKTEDNNFTAVSFNTKDRKNFKYGRIEVWAKLPEGEACQASVYLASDQGDADQRSEFNILEFFGGSRDGVVSTTAHYKHTSGHNVATAGIFELPKGKLSEKFHLYSIEWDDTQIRFYIDGVLYGSLPFNSAPLRDAFQREHYLGINISALAPSDPAKKTPSPDALKNTYPQYLQIDSVKYYPLEATEE